MATFITISIFVINSKYQSILVLVILTEYLDTARQGILNAD
ncbi:MAG: hypothetical protein ACJAS1_001986 [Oleiphilaceae bacterium]|jgi:hypothetical protein